jgi:hypothetical protein
MQGCFTVYATRPCLLLAETAHLIMLQESADVVSAIAVDLLVQIVKNRTANSQTVLEKCIAPCREQLSKMHLQFRTA